MNITSSFYRYAILLFCLYVPQVKPLIIGSSTVLSQEDSILFPAVDLLSANTAKGFAWLKNGFTLQDQTTTCSLELVFPVGGSVDARGGKIYLRNDLKLDNTASFSTMGSIYGSSYTLDCGLGVTAFPCTSNTTFDSLIVYLRNDVNLTGTLYITGACQFFGNNTALNLPSSGAIIVSPGASLTFNNMWLTNVNSNNLRAAASTSTTIFNDCTLQLSQNYSYTIGAMTMNGDNHITGPSFNFYYSSPQYLTIKTASSLIIDSGTTFYYGNPSALKDRILMTDSSSKLRFNNSSFATTSDGIMFTKGSMVIENTVIFDNTTGSSTNGIYLGNNSINQNVTLEYVPGGQLILNSGYLINRNI